MTPEIALLLIQDGISTGAIYVLVGLGIVLIFLVTRIIFVPFGDVVGYSALTLAALQLKQLPGTVWLVLILAVMATATEVSTIGIARINNPDELWQRLDALGDRQSYLLLERYIPGDVCHVDSLSRGGEPSFAEAHQYGRPPLDVFHEGGLAITLTLARESAVFNIVAAIEREPGERPAPGAGTPLRH